MHSISFLALLILGSSVLLYAHNLVPPLDDHAGLKANATVENHRHLIHSTGTGGCSVKHPTQEQLQATSRIVKNYFIRNPQHKSQNMIGSIQVPVFFHTIQYDSVTGMASQTTINALLSYMNDRYGKNTAFTFYLAGSDVSINPTWYNIKSSDPAAHEMALALRTGGKNMANIYMFNTPRDSWSFTPGGIVNGVYRDVDGVYVNNPDISNDSTRLLYDQTTLVHEVCLMSCIATRSVTSARTAASNALVLLYFRWATGLVWIIRFVTRLLVIMIAMALMTHPIS
jgi:hypothetical protein